MSSSTLDDKLPTATAVEVDDQSLSVQLSDGRRLSVPIGWFPRLSHSTADERRNWRYIGGGRGIRWPDLDEDISIENLLAGHPSHESQASLKKWLAARAQD